MTRLLQPMQPWTDDRVALLDGTYEQLQDDGDLTAAMDALSDALWAFRLQDSSEQWKEWVASVALQHPLRDLVHRDPFTHRSFTKPRGFAGDAGLIDLIYFDQGWVDLREVCDVGRRVFWRNRNAPAPRAVRERRGHCAALIDRAALRQNQARVLVVACGNLREGLHSTALQTGQLGTLVALDQDADALRVVAESFGGRVNCTRGSVRTIIARGMQDKGFDLIYAAGLYDYLERPVARRLTARLFELLNPGGELMVANFTHDVADVGYMESYMGWTLIYRGLDELHDVAAELPGSVRHNAAVYQLQSPDIGYLRLVKA